MFAARVMRMYLFDFRWAESERGSAKGLEWGSRAASTVLQRADMPQRLLYSLLVHVRSITLRQPCQSPSKLASFASRAESTELAA